MQFCGAELSGRNLAIPHAKKPENAVVLFQGGVYRQFCNGFAGSVYDDAPCKRRHVLFAIQYGERQRYRRRQGQSRLSRQIFRLLYVGGYTQKRYGVRPYLGVYLYRAQGRNGRSNGQNHGKRKGNFPALSST